MTYTVKYSASNTDLSYVVGTNFTVFFTLGTPCAFEHNELGDEYGGGIWADGQTITDYDGIMGYLPKEVCTILRAFKFDPSDCEETNNES